MKTGRQLEREIQAYIERMLLSAYEPVNRGACIAEAAEQARSHSGSQCERLDPLWERALLANSD